jgi:hypothetical protein
LGHRRFLPIVHRWRLQKAPFNGNIELRGAPVPLTGEACLLQLSTLNFQFGKKKKLANVGRKRKTPTPDVPMYDGPWKKQSIFFRLPYWKYNLLRHNLDVMHIEKNVCDNVVGTLLGLDGKNKDGLNARADLELLNLKENLHPVREGNKTCPLLLIHLAQMIKSYFVK